MAVLLVSLLAVGELLLFSDVFSLGEDLANALVVHPRVWNALAMAAVALFLLLYVLDVSYWPHRLGTFLRRFGVALVILLTLRCVRPRGS